MNTGDKNLESRLDRIEASLEKITEGLHQAPVMLSIATDSVDEVLGQAKNNGVDVDQRIQSGLQLLGRLSDPKINASLNGLIDLVDQGPGLVSMVADSVDENISQLNQGSVKLEDRISSVTNLLSKLSDPEIAGKLDKLLETAEQLPGLISMGVDSMDELMFRHGKDVQDNLSFLSKENLMFLKKAGDAFSEAKDEPKEQIGGVFAIMRSLKDPGRQKALGFLMNVLKKFGNKI